MLYNKCIAYGVTPSEKTPIGISNAIHTIANNQWSAGNTNGWSSGHTAGYNEGFSAGQAAATPIWLSNNINAPVLIGNPNAHRVTANSDLTGYRYVIVCFGWLNASMSLDGGYANTNCTVFTYNAVGSLGVAILQNVRNGATFDFQHRSGTGSGNCIAWGIK